MDNNLHPLDKRTAAIWTRGLTRRFGNEIAVDHIDLTIPRGAIFGFIGPSGSGKTTTVRLLTGLYAPSAGEMMVLGRSPDAFDATLRRRIGYMPQLFALYPDLSIGENLNFVGSIYGMSYRKRRQRFDELLDFVELQRHRRKLARDISGGMQRRLSLAATLLHNPDLLFLDEPTAGIDPVLRRKFWDRFAGLKERGQTLFVTTQYVGEAAYCDYVGVLVDGRLIALDTPLGLRKRVLGGEVVNLSLADSVNVQLLAALRALPFVRRDIAFLGPTLMRITVDDASTDIPALLSWCSNNQLEVRAIDEHVPPYDDLFVQLVKEATVSAESEPVIHA